MTDSKEKIFDSLEDAAQYCHMTRQAIFKAIQTKSLKAEKKPKITSYNKRIMHTWHIRLSDLEEYRKNRYSYEKKKVNGQKLYDLQNEKWNVSFTAKVLSLAWGIPVDDARIYYLLRTGELKGYKKGRNWVMLQKDVEKLAQERAPKRVDNPDQLTFA